MRNYNRMLFYIGFAMVELSVGILTLSVPILFFALGSSFSELSRHANNLTNYRILVNSTSLAIFLVGILNMVFSSASKRTFKVVILVLDCVTLLGYICCILVSIIKSNIIFQYLLHGINGKNTINLIENYFNCSVEPAMSAINCVDQMTALSVKASEEKFIANPFIAVFAVMASLLIFLQIIAIIIIGLNICDTDYRKHTEKPQKHRMAHTSSVTAQNHDATRCKSGWFRTLGNNVKRGINLFKGALSNAFGYLGMIVATNPKQCIVIIVTFTVTCAVGFLQYNLTPLSFELFIPPDSEPIKHKQLVSETFKDSGERVQRLIVSGDNVLDPEFIQALLNLDSRIKSLQTKEGKTFENLCTKINGICKQRSILELWNFDQRTILNLTYKNILDAVNRTPLISPVFNSTLQLGRIIGTRNVINSTVFEAKDLLITYFTRDTIGYWEDEFVQTALTFNSSYLKVYASAQQSLETEQNKVITIEMVFLAAGSFLMFMYTVNSIGKYSLIRHRLWLTTACFINIAMAIGTGLGIAFAMGLAASPMANLISFLIIGIGIDDMFIITQTWDKISMSNVNIELKTVAEITMKKAGIAILVTSLTDSIVFFCGPAGAIKMIHDFNIMCALSLVALFVYQCTFVFAVLQLDQRRQDNLYDGCFVCLYKHSEPVKEYNIVEEGIIQWAFNHILCKYVDYKYIKILIITISIVVTCTMAYFVTQMKVHIELNFYMSADSYMHKYFTKENSLPKDFGLNSQIHIMGNNLYENWENIEHLHHEVTVNPYVQNGTIVSVVPLLQHLGLSSLSSEEQFMHYLNKILQTKELDVFRDDVVLGNGSLRALKFRINHVIATYSFEDEKAFQNISNTCNNIPWKNATAFPFTYDYVPIYSARNSFNNLKRNLVVVTICVTVIVFMAVLNYMITFWVSLTILMTLLNVAGVISALGFTIEPITALGLTLSVGLVVDFSVHIGHYYLFQSGTRTQRAKEAIKEIGPAVWHGGFSTFLIVVFLFAAETYIYFAFCLELSFVILFGLWHGLFFLPSILSFFGPESISTEREERVVAVSCVIRNEHSMAIENGHL